MTQNMDLAYISVIFSLLILPSTALQCYQKTATLSSSPKIDSKLTNCTEGQVCSIVGKQKSIMNLFQLDTNSPIQERATH